MCGCALKEGAENEDVSVHTCGEVDWMLVIPYLLHDSAEVVLSEMESLGSFADGRG